MQLDREKFLDVTNEYDVQWRNTSRWTRTKLIRALYGTFCFDLGAASGCGAEIGFNQGQRITLTKTLQVKGGVSGAPGGVGLSAEISSQLQVAAETEITTLWSRQTQECEWCEPVGCHEKSYILQSIIEGRRPRRRLTTTRAEFVAGSRLRIYGDCKQPSGDCGCGDTDNEYRIDPAPAETDGQTGSSCLVSVVGLEDSGGLNHDDVDAEADLAFVESLTTHRFGTTDEPASLFVRQPFGRMVNLTNADPSTFDFAVLSVDAIDEARFGVRIRHDGTIPVFVAAPLIGEPWASVAVARKRVPAIAGHRGEIPADFWQEWASGEDILVEANLRLLQGALTAGWQDIDVPVRAAAEHEVLTLQIEMGSEGTDHRARVVIPIDH